LRQRYVVSAANAGLSSGNGVMSMLRDLKHLHGRTVVARDGDIGSVQDIYFDDEAWGVR
jgi:uncharacterized protein YrrD